MRARLHVPSCRLDEANDKGGRHPRDAGLTAGGPAQILGALCPPSLLKSPPFAVPPPPPGGGWTVTSLFDEAISIVVVCFPHLSHTHVLALLCRYFESLACVYFVIFSLQRWCTGCGIPFQDVFLPGTVYRTTHAHLLHMCWPLLWNLYTKWAAILPHSVQMPWWGSGS